MTFLSNARLAAIARRIQKVRAWIQVRLAASLLVTVPLMIGAQLSVPHGLHHQPHEQEIARMSKPEAARPTKPIPLNEQIAIVKRRLLQIENKYPRLVKEHAITQERAENEIARFRAVLDTLIVVKMHADATTKREIDQMNASAEHLEHKQTGLPLSTGNEQAPYKTGGANDVGR